MSGPGISLEPESQSPIFDQCGVLPGFPSSNTATSAGDQAGGGGERKLRPEIAAGAPENCLSAASSSRARVEIGVHIYWVVRVAETPGRILSRRYIIKNRLDARQAARNASTTGDDKTDFSRKPFRRHPP